MHIFALVGPSGTGKSHHALFVAQEYHIDMIIDDGLLIERSRILAGHSAKRSPTRIGAIKTALFAEDQHAREVADVIAEHMPKSILILGTSTGMVDKIAQRLNIPHPETYINIESVASAREIKKARQIRDQFGTHVIPAPTVEVKPKFSGNIISPLRSFFNRRVSPERPSLSRHLWVEQTVVRPSFNYLGRFFIANDVISEIAAFACRDMAGISRFGKITVDNSEQGLLLHVDTYLIYGHHIIDVLTDAQKRIKETVEQMTSLHIISIDMHAVQLVLES